jgi:hypothetical protein
MPTLLRDNLATLRANLFLRLRTFHELSLGENFSSTKDSLPRALISGRGSSRTCAYLLRDFRATGTDILEGSTPPCAEMLPDFSWPERTPPAGRGLPSALAVNRGSTGPTPTQLLHMVAGAM